MVGVGPGIEPFGREHRMLRRLHHGRLAGAVGEFNEPLDPQQIVAAVLRQSAEGAGEVEPADRSPERDGKGSDAVTVGVRCGAPEDSLSPGGAEGWGEGAGRRYIAGTLTRPRLRLG